MVDFVKNKSGMPVGSQLTFARGLASKLEIDGAVWLQNGVFETDKSKFDVDYWRRAAYYLGWTTNLPVTFTQLAMGKVAGKRLTLFTKSTGTTVYGTKDDGKTVEPILTDSSLSDQVYIFWYKNRFFIQMGNGAVRSITWDGTALGALTTESNLQSTLNGSRVTCVNVLGDKIVLGTDIGELVTSNDGVTWTPVAVWNSSAKKTEMGTVSITSVAIAKTGDTFAAIGYSTTATNGFIVQVNNQFAGTGQTLVFDANFTDPDYTIEDKNIIHAGGYWFCNVWYWTTTPDKRQPVWRLCKGSLNTAYTEAIWLDLGDQIAFIYPVHSNIHIADVETMVFSISSYYGYDALPYRFYKTAVDLEDKILIGLNNSGDKLTVTHGIVAGAEVSDSSTHTRIK